jgi:NTP pyrophosphatase (non-canonical NTP hydrolase)
MINKSKLQEYYRQWREKFPDLPDPGEHTAAEYLVCEAGEVLDIQIRKANPEHVRGTKISQDKLEAELFAELGDVAFMLCNVAEQSGVNLLQALKATCLKHEARLRRGE